VMGRMCGCVEGSGGESGMGGGVGSAKNALMGNKLVTGVAWDATGVVVLGFCHEC